MNSYLDFGNASYFIRRNLIMQQDNERTANTTNDFISGKKAKGFKLTKSNSGHYHN